jgi:hypothetical protein
LETKGQDTEQDKIKRRFLEEWVRAVSAHGGFGRWRDATQTYIALASWLSQHYIFFSVLSKNIWHVADWLVYTRMAV